MVASYKTTRRGRKNEKTIDRRKCRSEVGMGIIGRGQKDNEIGTGRMEKERLKSV